jgi:hypothetical protein
MSPADLAQRQYSLAEMATAKSYLLSSVVKIDSTGIYGLSRRVPSERLPAKRKPIPFELVEKLVPNNANKSDDLAPTGIYERILDRYPNILSQTKQVLIAVLIVEIALFSFLLGDSSDAAILAGLALFATSILYFVFRSALTHALGIRSYRISAEQEHRLLSIMDEMARASSRQ